MFPKTIAIVGASERPGNWARGVWDGLRRHGYAGRVYPVNPRYETIWDGERCYAALDALPDTPDHVVVVVPGRAAIEAIAAAGSAGARSATIFSSGFGEGGGAEGRVLQSQLAEAIRASGLAVSGPNCTGNLSARARMLTIPDDRITSLEPGPVAVFGQSGGIVMAMQRALANRGMAVGYCVTSGNEIGLTGADYIRFFAADPETRVIACFIEAIRDPDDFLDACAAARDAGKPIVALKLGGSPASRAAALAHTGSLAGSLDCFDAAAGAAGVIRLDTIDEVVEAAEFLAHARIPEGPRLAAMTFSGGLKGMLIEAAGRVGATFPPLADATIEQLREILGVGTSLGNPLDAGFAALSSSEAYFRCIDTLLKDPNFDVLMVQEELPQRLGTNRKVENLREVSRNVGTGVAKPIAVFSMASYMLTDESRGFRRELPHLPFMQEVEKTVRVLHAIGSYRAARQRPRPEAASRRPHADAAQSLLRARPVGNGLSVLDEADSKRLLQTYGMAVPDEAVVASADEARAAADRMRFPLVLKLLSHEVTHKSDVGGVVLNLESAAAVAKAFSAMSASLAHQDPPIRLERALLARQIKGGVEVVLGVQRDPEVGPVIMFGGGGTLLEIHKDVAFGPVPLSEEAAHEMIGRTRVSRILDGYRGDARRDREAVVASLVALGRLAHDLRDRIESVDVNPCSVLAAGEGAWMLDAVVILRDRSKAK